MKTLNSILMPVLATEDKNNTNYMIAYYIMKHVDSLADTSTASLAEACNVSKASISRFCKYVGLDDFYTLKYLIKQHNQEAVSEIKIKQTNIFDDFRDSLALLEKKIVHHDLHEIASDIYRSSNVILMGTPQTFSAIITLQHHLSTLGKIVTVSVQANEQEHYLVSGNQEDVILIFSQTSEFLREVMAKQSKMNRANKPKIYLFTLQNTIAYPYVYRSLELGINSPFVFSTYVEIIFENYKQYQVNGKCLEKKESMQRSIYHR